MTDVATDERTPAAPVRRGDRFALWLGLIVLAAFVIRVVYILTLRQDFFSTFRIGGDPFDMGDSYLYQRGAQLLVDGHGFVNPYQWDLFHLRQEDASHVPLFMLWLTVPHLLGIHGAEAAALWSAVLGAGTIVLVGLAGREIVGPRVGLVAAALAAVYPNVFSHDGFLQSETMAIFTVTLAVWLGYRYWHRPTGWNAVWVATACALAGMSRSELILLVVLLFVPLVLWTKRVDLKERFRWIVLGGVAVAVVIGPWVVFNLTRFERPVTLSDNFGYTLLTATCDSTYYGDGVGYWDYRCAEPTYVRIQAQTRDRSENEAVFRDEALDYISEHKGRLAYVTLVRWARFAGIWDLTHGFDQVDKDRIVEGRDGLAAWGGALMFYPLAILSVVGGIALARRRITLIPLVAPLVTVLVAVTLTFYMNRYRASAETCLCLLAAVGIDAVVRRAGRARRPALASEPEVE